MAKALEKEQFARLEGSREIQTRQLQGVSSGRKEHVSMLQKTALITESLPVYEQAFKAGGPSCSEYKTPQAVKDAKLKDYVGSFGVL